MPANDPATPGSAAAGSFRALRFAARDLASAEILYALPLVRATWPAMDRIGWQEFVASFCADATLRPAITALSDPGGGLCGLFASRVDHPIGRRVLAVPLFTVVDIGNSLEPVRALANAVEVRAAETGCMAVDVRLGKGQAGLRKRLLRIREQHAAARSAIENAPHGLGIH